MEQGSVILLRIIPAYVGAVDGIRTRGLELGRIALYQLRYYRI